MNPIPDESGPLDHHRPRNRANADQPQEEFIDAQGSHFDIERDQEHGDELLHASHGGRWAGGN